MKPLKSLFLQNYRAHHEKQENKHHQYLLIANPVHKSAASTMNKLPVTIKLVQLPGWKK